MTFYEPTTIDWAGTIADNYKAIAGEYEALRDELFMESPKVEMYQGGWDVFGFIFRGSWIHSHCELCPTTTRLLHEVPGLVSAAFSILGPESQILPHDDPDEELVRLDLGLVVPPGCGIRVANTACPQVNGGSYVFDPSVEHEAWNLSPKTTRALLTIDFVRPMDLPEESLP